jgi:hypothetical protein
VENVERTALTQDNELVVSLETVIKRRQSSDDEFGRFIQVDL